MVKRVKTEGAHAKNEAKYRDLLESIRETALESRVKEGTAELRCRAELLNLARDAIFVRDLQGRIVFWNGGAERLFGWSSDQATGQVSQDMLQMLLPGSLDEIARVMSEAGLWEGELRHRAKDGREIATLSRWTIRRDEGQVWMRAGEQLSRELADLTTTCRDIEARPIQALPQAPTPAPILGINEGADASAITNTCADVGGTEIVKALEAIPVDSTITFATNDLGVLLLAGAPIVRGTEAYRQVEHLAQACNCSVSLQEETGTVTFTRNETEPVPVDAIQRVAEEDWSHPAAKVN